ncbi:GtrA family protein [Candidatus Venteria ishoeyi]|uniref:GtrA family protein n=1 Tax=Candidatus Venteria ishoeyi TaxID=1899563 RepID=UPI00387EC393
MYFFKKQNLKFAVVGILTTIIYFSMLYCVIEYLRISIIIASSFSYILSIIFNYLSHYHWTFYTTSSHTTALSRFFIMNMIGFLINFVIMHYASVFASHYYLFIQLISIIIITIWNFMLSSFWVYKKREID